MSSNDTTPRPQTSGIIQKNYRIFLVSRCFHLGNPRILTCRIQGDCILTYLEDTVGLLTLKESSEQTTNTEVFIYSVKYMKRHYE
jgi:hypothetical protein